MDICACTRACALHVTNCSQLRQQPTRSTCTIFGINSWPKQTSSIKSFKHAQVDWVPFSCSDSKRSRRRLRRYFTYVLTHWAKGMMGLSWLLGIASRSAQEPIDLQRNVTTSAFRFIIQANLTHFQTFLINQLICFTKYGTTREFVYILYAYRRILM